MGLDIQIVEILNAVAGKSFLADWIIVFFASYLGYMMALAVVGLALVTVLARFRYLRRKNGELFILVVLSTVAARLGVTEIIRFFYNRPRPFEVFEGVRQLVEHSSGGSFPSGHAALAFALATSVFLVHRRWGILFFVLALAVGLGRIAAGIHWPTDILAGAIIGIASAFLIKRLFFSNQNTPV